MGLVENLREGDDGMQNDINRKRKIIIGILMLLIICQVVFVWVVSINMNKGQGILTMAFDDLVELRQVQYDMIIRAQTYELKHLEGQFFNFLDLYEDAYEDAYEDLDIQVFIDTVIRPRKGLDGERMAVVFDQNGEVLYISREAELYKDELKSMSDPNYNVLFPSVLITGDDPDLFPYPSIRYDRYYWNKIVIPNPSSVRDRYVIFYGFKERILFWEIGVKFDNTRTNIFAFEDVVKGMFSISLVILIGVFILGSILSVLTWDAIVQIGNGYEKVHAIIRDTVETMEELGPTKEVK